MSLLRAISTKGAKKRRRANRTAGSPRFAITDTIEVIGGAKPKTLNEFLREERA